MTLSSFTPPHITGLPAGNFTLEAWLDQKTTLEQPVILKGNIPCTGTLVGSSPRGDTIPSCFSPSMTQLSRA